MNTPNDTDNYIIVPITKGQVAWVSPEDADLAELKWTALPSTTSESYYVYRRPWVNGRQEMLYMHRLVLSRVLKREIVKGEHVDHIDGNPLNNRRTNLRVATDSQNKMNRGKQKDNTTGYKGVTYKSDRRKWVAQIKKDRKNYYLGGFNTPEEAYAAYCAKAKELHGEFCNLGQE